MNTFLIEDDTNMSTAWKRKKPSKGHFKFIQTLDI